jgi:hypothetical protein
MTTDNWELIFTWMFYGWFIGFGCGIFMAKMLFGRIINDKADTGIRLESGGKLYTVHSVETEK